MQNVSLKLSDKANHFVLGMLGIHLVALIYDLELPRRAKLKSGWYFDCTCTRCSDPMECDSFTSVTACLRCQVGNILPKNPLDPASDWFCHNCGFKVG